MSIVNNVVVQTLQPSELDEWVNHCGTIFDVGPAYFRRHFVSDPDKCYESIFVIKEDDKIVSTVRVFYRNVYIDSKIYKMGGIGEVSTNPDYRSKGYSATLLKTAVEYMKANGFVISMLGTGYFSHYAKHGYIQCNYYTKSVKGGKIIKGDFDIRTLNADNFHAMAELYNKHSSKLNCSLVRSKDYWKSWCSGEIKNPHGLFRNGKIVGYICYNGNTVTEIAAEDNDCDILLSAVPPEEDIIKIPAFVTTKRTIIVENCDNAWMINVFGDVIIDGVVYNTAESLSDYFNQNGGIVLWSQDHF